MMVEPLKKVLNLKFEGGIIHIEKTITGSAVKTVGEKL